LVFGVFGISGDAHMTEATLVIYLSNILPAFVYPVGSTIVILVLAAVLLLAGRRRIAAATIVVALCWMWVAATPFVAESLIRAIERQFPPVGLSQTPVADVAIVLGGALGGPNPPRVAIELGKGSSRILQATRLYRAGKVSKILVVGGNVPWEGNPVPEAEYIRDLLVEWGVPPDAILTTGQSRNTFENALEAANLREKLKFGSALLITSGTHMPRAIAVFRHAGLEVTASTSDVTAVEHPLTIIDFVPTADALEMTTTALKERIGYLVYRWRGHL
jgi:uncharacterized SAM-binding protein YcdF (DUF218 family)